MSNLTPLPFQLSDGETGLPQAFSELYFTLTGTITPTPVYTGADLCTEHENPVVADDAGVYPAIYLDPEIVVRVRGIQSGGDLNNPDFDIDPVNELPLTLTPELIEAALGYVPVDPGNATFTAEVRLNYDDPLAILHADSAGFRGRPTVITDAGHTLELDDAGKMLLKDDTSSPSVIIDTEVAVPFPVGTVVYFMNVNTGTLTLSRESGVELRIAGAATNQDVAIAQWGKAELVKYDTNKWMVSGNGLS